MATYDDLPLEVRRERFGWFGEPWWSYVCYDEAGSVIEETRKTFPAGESCLYCGEEFSEEAGDSGQATVLGKADGTAEIVHVHKECQFRQGTGGLAHHEKRCRCYGGEGHDTPGMTARQEAVEVWRRHHAGTLFGGAKQTGGGGG